MNKIAKFEKVSFEQFKKDYLSSLLNMDENVSGIDSKILKIYNNIKLPERATKCSAGYDFFTPFEFHLAPGKSVLIPTGIKCNINFGWMLQIYPRSGHGFKYGVHLANTVGIIDGDYYNNCGNEGHIFVKLVNDSTLAEDINIQEGTAFCQGIFSKFGFTEDDDVDAVRTGGMGSTTKKVEV